MGFLKKSMNGLIVVLFELIVGILLLVNPKGFTIGIVMVAGVALMAVGLIQIIKYFRTDAEEAAKGQFMLKGLIALLAGVFCAIKVEWFVENLPALTIIYGILVLVTGLSKVQQIFDMIRSKNKKWYFVAINAVLSFVFAAIILCNPFKTMEVLLIFTGIVLIVEAVADIVSIILAGKKDKPVVEEKVVEEE